MLVLIENATAVFKESEEDDGGGGRCYIIKTQTGFHGVLVILPEQWKTLLLISGEEKPRYIHGKEKKRTRGTNLLLQRQLADEKMLRKHLDSWAI